MTSDDDFDERMNLEDEPRTRASRREAGGTNKGLAQRIFEGVVLAGLIVIVLLTIAGIIGGLIYFMSLIFGE
ncbi:MAG TPA: hypothetical protein VM715_12735 [Candidatus Acidoferrum sp.]|nr:hypothetical protein [Candidatus Acidoferrum sp.]